MKIIVTIDLEGNFADARNPARVAELLRMHAADLERTQGAPGIKTVMDEHVVINTWVDASASQTVAEFRQSAAGRAQGLPTAPKNASVKPL